MAFNLTTEFEEWRSPFCHQTGRRAAVAHAHAMHRVGARAAGLVAPQVWLETRHVGEEKIRHLHIGHDIPWLAHAAFVRLARAMTSLGIPTAHSKRSLVVLAQVKKSSSYTRAQGARMIAW